MWEELITSNVGSFECVLSKVAGSAKNGTGRRRTWKVRPILRDGSAPSRCVVLGRLCLWRGWNPQRKSISNGKPRSSARLQEVLVGIIPGRLRLWCGWNSQRQTSEREVAELGKHGTHNCTAFRMGLHVNKM